ncbi:MAG: DMT family transporter, partial [Alphaproteobacteria bacterium]|nr:DMT family transporter [Alphaproteobacteria bacterium]
TSPLLVMTLGHFVLDDEKLRLRRLAGVAFGAVGIVILVGPDAFRHMTDHVWGQLAVFAAAICFAITAVSARGLSADQALGNATLSLLLSTVIICPMAVVLDRPWQIAPSMTSLMAVLWLSVLPMALATFIYLRLIAANGANFVSSKNFVTPVIGVIAGSFALGERLEPRAFVALAVIMIGIAIAESSRLKRR